ncbi:hypothetical protein [Trinickia sp.]|uniref:hypothetical protein n=1 Tax=Trinickia sp. TaxID=2571163 RepID=UPI003F7EFF03
MERRAFIHASLGAAAIGAVMPWIDCYGVLNDSNEQVLVVVDPALPASCAYVSAASSQLCVLLRDDADVGRLWHARLRDWRGAIKGVVRPSDCFVLRNLSVGQGRAFRSAPIGPSLEAEAGDAGFGRRSRNTTAVAFEIAAAAPARR